MDKANGYFNAYGNAARKDNQDYFVSSYLSVMVDIHSNDTRYTLGIISTRMLPEENEPTNRLDYCSPCMTTELDMGRYVRWDS